jgi:hypothetical protein
MLNPPKSATKSGSGSGQKKPASIKKAAAVNSLSPTAQDDSNAGVSQLGGATRIRAREGSSGTNPTPIGGPRGGRKIGDRK